MAPKSVKYSTIGMFSQFQFIQIESFIENTIVFYSFSQEISEINFDDSAISKEIHFAIRNAYGYLPGEFEPYNVFECFVRKQIDQLEGPIRECIDLVVEELISAVRKSTEQVSNFSLFLLINYK